MQYLISNKKGAATGFRLGAEKVEPALVAGHNMTSLILNFN